jgi:hypothetical protein
MPSFKLILTIVVVAVIVVALVFRVGAIKTAVTGIPA